MTYYNENETYNLEEMSCFTDFIMVQEDDIHTTLDFIRTDVRGQYFDYVLKNQKLKNKLFLDEYVEKYIQQYYIEFLKRYIETWLWINEMDSQIKTYNINNSLLGFEDIERKIKVLLFESIVAECKDEKKFLSNISTKLIKIISSP